MNQVYSTKDKTSLIITNSDATTKALAYQQNQKDKTVEVFSVTENQKELLFTLNTHEAMKAISDFLNDSSHTLK